MCAISFLTRECTNDRPTPYHFVINGNPVVSIFDVPHLLKNTRNALISCNIQYETNKTAKMCYLRKAFDADNCERAFTCLDKIKQHFFNFAVTYIKMKVKIAAKQLSHTMAAAIETFYTSGIIPESESLHTAEVVDLMDKLFDSLNSSQFYDNEEVYMCSF
mgnify:CR=1 FL=1